MGERPDEIGRRDPLGAGDRVTQPLAGETGFDPATDAFEPDAITPDPALRDESEVDEIEITRVEIERTRAGMSETVDAIQERLSPENLKEQAKDRVKEATVGKAQEPPASGVDGHRSGLAVRERQKAGLVPTALSRHGLPGCGLRRGLSSHQRVRSRRPRLPVALRGRERLLDGPGAG